MENNLPVSKTKTDSGKAEIIRVLIIAVISFVVGFALIFFVFKKSSPDVSEQELPPDASESVNQVAEGDRTTPPTAAGVTIVPPGDTPTDMRIDGAPRYLKCWDESGIEHDGNECDTLPGLEDRFAERLYVVHRCRNEKTDEDTTGRLSVASEVNFVQGNISFWNGASSTIRNASGIGSCLRSALAGLPLEGIDHSFARYRVFFTVEFGQEPAAPAAVAVANAPPPGDGKVVEVAKTRVRVRASAPDGEIIGKISTPNKVRLLKQDGDWCNVVTPNNNTGWMICSALDI